MIQLPKQRSLQYPIPIKATSDSEAKQYHLTRLYESSLKSIAEKPQLTEPTDEQKELLLHLLKQPTEYWQRWFVDQYFTKEQRKAMGLTDKGITKRGIK